MGSGVWCVGVFRALVGKWSLFLTMVTERRGLLHSEGTWAWITGVSILTGISPPCPQQVSSSTSRAGAAPGLGSANSLVRKPPEMESWRSGEQRCGPWGSCPGLWGPRAEVGAWGMEMVAPCSHWGPPGPVHLKQGCHPMIQPKSHRGKQEGPFQGAHGPQVTTLSHLMQWGLRQTPQGQGPSPPPTEPCALVVSSQGGVGGLLRRSLLGTPRLLHRVLAGRGPIGKATPAPSSPGRKPPGRPPVQVTPPIPGPLVH